MWGLTDSRVVAVYGLSKPVERLVAAGDHLYVAGWGEFRVVDISSVPSIREEGAAPFEASWLSTTALIAMDDTVYAFGKELVIFDVSDPQTPTTAAQITAESEAWAGCVRAAVACGQRVYAFCMPETGESPYILTLDVSDPRSPEAVGMTETPQLSSRYDSGQVALAADGQRLCAVGRVVEIYDTSDGGLPASLGHVADTSLTLSTLADTADAYLSGAYLYIVRSPREQGGSGLQVVYIDAAPAIVFYGDPRADRLVLSGNRAVTATFGRRERWMTVWDASNPRELRPLVRTPIRHYALSFVVSGGYVLSINGGSVGVIATPEIE